MPLYEYLCRACAHQFERIVKFSDAPLRTCPNCGKETVDQMISAPAVQFKGTGWYVTDYARKNSAGAGSSTSKPDSAPSAATGSASSSSSDSGSSGTASGSSSSAPASSSSDAK